MANQKSSFKYIKMSLILMNSFVVFGLIFSLLLEDKVDGHEVMSRVIFGWIFILGYIGAVSESRRLIMGAGFYLSLVTYLMIIVLISMHSGSTYLGSTSPTKIAKILLMMANNLVLVVLSFTFSAMLDKHQECPVMSEEQNILVSPRSVPITSTEECVVQIPPSLPESYQNSVDPPPTYDDCRPPQYAEAMRTNKVQM